jgi:hypothetical protein
MRAEIAGAEFLQEAHRVLYGKAVSAFVDLYNLPNCVRGFSK